MHIQGKIWCTDGPDPLVEPVGDWLDKVITEALCHYMDNGFFNMEGGDRIGFQCAEPISHDCTMDLEKLLIEWGLEMYKNINTGKIEGEESIAHAIRLRGILLKVAAKIDFALKP